MVTEFLIHVKKARAWWVGGLLTILALLAVAAFLHSRQVLPYEYSLL